jgi:hypothetical protein
VARTSNALNGREPGKSRLPPETRCSVQVNVLLTPAEAAEVRALAGLHRVSLSNFLRRVVCRYRLPRAVARANLQAWARLGPVAADLNQYVKAIRQGEAGEAPLALLLELRQLLDALREELRGGGGPS